MDVESLGKQRCEIIEKAINIESLINLVIGQHYFKGHNQSFLEEVLCDEAFTFGLRLHVLQKIAPSLTCSSLHRIIYIRNRFAHCHPIFLEINPTGVGRRVAIDPKHPQKTVDFEALYSEFNNLYPTLEKELVGLLNLKGGKLGPPEVPIK